MHLLELAAQAVRGFSPSARMQFKPGYNVLVPPQSTDPGLTALLTALLYGDGRGGDGALASGTAARAGLSLQGMDGKTYRLMRVLGSGGALHCLEPGGRWSVISQDAGEIAQALRAALRLPTRGQFEGLFCFDAKMFPSKRPVGAPPAKARAPAAVEPRALQPNALVEAAMAAAASAHPKQLGASRARQDLERLRQEVEAGKQVDGCQYRLEGAQQKLFDLDRKLEELHRLKEEVKAARDSLEGMASLESLNLPKDALERAGRYDEARKKRDEALEKVREEQRAAEEASQVAPRSLWRDAQFSGALGAGAILFGAAVAFRGSPWGYLGLLDVPAFGYAGLLALRWVGELQTFDGLSRRRDIFRDREQKVEAAFEHEYLPIRGAMKLIGAEKGADLLEHLRRRDATEAAAREAEERLAAAEADPRTASLRAEKAGFEAEASELEAKLSALGAAATRDWRDAEREMAELERALEAPAPVPEKAAPASAAPAVPAGSAEVERASEDPVPHLLSMAEDLFPGLSLEALAGALRERAGQYFAALTDKRFSGLELDAGGRAKAVAPGRTMPAGALEAGDSDFLYLSVRIALLEKAAPASKVIILLDEPFAWLDAPKQQILSKAFKLIAAHTQVVHATALSTHRALADAALRG